MKYDYILWDFNGTILDDVKICLKIINIMMKERKLKPISMESYTDNMCFPIANYYKLVGLPYEGEEFNNLSVMFNDYYLKNWEKHTKLAKGFIKVADFINKVGIKQIIISASKKENLVLQTKILKIDHIFEDMVGQNGINAESKIQYSKKYVDNRKINPKRILYIGDTIHDYEVASNIKCDYLIYTKGHQSKKALKSVKTIDNLSDIIKYI
jgi:phosphoglycolate phosphatase